jgi:hypothetical protein
MTEQMRRNGANDGFDFGQFRQRDALRQIGEDILALDQNRV